MQQQVQYLLLFQAFCLGSNELKKEVENGSMINNHQSKVNNYSNQIWGPTKTRGGVELNRFRIDFSKIWQICELSNDLLANQFRIISYLTFFCTLAQRFGLIIH